MIENYLVNFGLLSLNSKHLSIVIVASASCKYEMCRICMETLLHRYR